MIRKDTILKDCFLLEPVIYRDARGLFFESYNREKFEALLGRAIEFVQDNHSVSNKGVLRGLHFQKGKHAQAKLVSVVMGSALDVIVDLRPESPTYGKHFKSVLHAEESRMIFIPRGMAHGFLALEDNTVFTYKCDNYYARESEAGIYFNDPDLGIDWGYPLDKMVISDKDKALPTSKMRQT